MSEFEKFATVLIAVPWARQPRTPGRGGGTVCSSTTTYIVFV